MSRLFRHRKKSKSSKYGTPLRNSSGRGIRANRGRGGCVVPRRRGNR